MARIDRAKAERRIDWLISEIARHDALYYLRDRPEITDAEYDRLRRELVDLEAAWPDLARPDSPTHRVGVPASEASFAPFEHRVPMLSLENAVALEAIARLAHGTLALGPGVALEGHIARKHHDRKHGGHAYYGQAT